MGKNAKSDLIVLPPFTLVFPDLFAPKVSELTGKESYGILMLFDERKSAVDLGPLRAMVEQIKKEVFGGYESPIAKFPIKNGNDMFQAGKAKLDAGVSDSSLFEIYEHKTVVRASSNFKPEVRNRETGRLIEDPAEIYGGCLCRAHVHLWGYSEQTYAGITLTLASVEKLRDGKRIGGGARPDSAKAFDSAGEPDLSEFDDLADAVNSF